MADGANRLRAYQAIDRKRRRRATPGGRNTVQHLLDGPDVVVAIGSPVANRSGDRAWHGNFSFSSPHTPAWPTAAPRRSAPSRFPGLGRAGRRRGSAARVRRVAAVEGPRAPRKIGRPAV